MESNGKTITKGGQRVNYETGVSNDVLPFEPALTTSNSRLSGVLLGPMVNIPSTN